MDYLHLAIDDHSRVAYSEILPDEKRRSCLRFLFNTLRFFRAHGVKVQRVMTDNGTSFRSRRYPKALRLLKIKHLRTNLHAEDQGQGRTLRPNLATRVGLRPSLSHLGSPGSASADLAASI
jgi:hypothetical protein